MQKFLDSFDIEEDYVRRISKFTDVMGEPYFDVELRGNQLTSTKSFYNKIRTNYFDNKFNITETEKNVSFNLYFDSIIVGSVSLPELFDLSWRCDSENVPYGLQVHLFENLELNPETTTFEAWTLNENEAEICILSKEWSRIHKRKIQEDYFFNSKKFLYFGESLFYGNVKWSRIPIPE